MSRFEKIKNARANAMSQRLVKNPNSEERENIPLNEDMEKIGAGIGTLCYFSLMKQMGFLFGGLSIIALISAFLFSFFDHSPTGDFADGFVSRSLGNLVLPLISKRFSVSLYYLILIPEVAFCVVYFKNYHKMKKSLKETAKKADDGFITAGDFCLKVSKIPAGIKDVSVISDHFSKFGEVHSVLLCYDIRDFGSTQIQLDEAVYRYRLAVYSRDPDGNAGAIENLRGAKNLTDEERIVDLDAYEEAAAAEAPTDTQTKIEGFLRMAGFKKDEKYWAGVVKTLLSTREKAALKNPEELPTTGVAFVMYDVAKDADAVAVRYKKETKKNLLSEIQSQSDDLKLNGAPLDVTLNLEPSDIQFQYLGYTPLQILTSQLIPDAVSVVLVFLGVVISVVMNAVKGANTSLAFTISLVITAIASGIDFAVQALSRLNRHTTATGAVLSKLFRLWFSAFLLVSLATLIASYFVPYRTATTLVLPSPSAASASSTGGGIVITDCASLTTDLIKGTLGAGNSTFAKLSSFAANLTAEGAAANATAVNATAAAAAAATGKAVGKKAAKEAAKKVGAKAATAAAATAAAATAANTTTNATTNATTNLTSSLVTNISNNCTIISRYVMSRAWFREVAYGLFTNVVIDVVKTSLMEFTHVVDWALLLYYVVFAPGLPQYELNTAFAAPAWPLEVRMAHMVKITMMGLVLSPIVPLVNWVIAAYFLIQYWVDKYNLLRWYRSPAQYSNLLVAYVQKAVLNGLHAHCIATIVFHVLLLFTNKPHAGFLHYLPIVLYTLGYLVFVISRFGVQLGKFWKGGVFAAAAEATEASFTVSEDDETLGLPFEAYEEILETYVDRFPIFQDGSNLELSAASSSSFFVAADAKQQKKNECLAQYRVTKEDGSVGYDTRPPSDFCYYSYLRHGSSAYQHDVKAHRLPFIARAQAQEYKELWEKSGGRK